MDSKINPLSRRQLISLAIVLAIGLTFSVVSFHIAKESEREDIQNQFAQYSKERANILQGALADDLTLLYSLAAFYEGSNFVERKEFQNFVDHQLRLNPEILTLEWIPRVKDADRLGFEASVQAEGIGNFRIKERDPKVEMVPALERKEYFPITYVEPFGAHQSLLGFDYGSEPFRLQRLERARDLGKPVTIPIEKPFKGRGLHANEHGVQAVMPVYKNGMPHESLEDRRANLEGFVSFFFTVGKFAEIAIEPLSSVGIHFYLYDTSAQKKRLLYTHVSRTKNASIFSLEEDKKLSRQSGLFWATGLDLTGTKWQMECYPSAEFIRAHRLWKSLTFLIVSLFLLILLTAYLYFSFSYTARVERLVKERTSLLVRSEKMAALGQLAAGIAHEVNNPIAAILGFSQSSLQRIQPGDSLEMPLQTIEREAQRCKTIVQNLLAFSRSGKTEKAEIDLNAIIESTLSFIIAQTKVKNVELLKELEPGLPKLVANKNQLQQVIVNLSNNAIDAMPKGGKLKISTHKISSNGKNQIEIRIQDTGEGMPEDIKAKIFEPFFTTKGEGKGTGLGLSLVQNIVTQHQGQISVESEAGRGTTFYILLPLVVQVASLPA